MDSLDAQTIVDEIAAHIRKQGGLPSAWYVGITQDVDQRLFADHQVPRKDHWFIHRRAVSSEAARAAEESLLKWGCSGGSGGGDLDAIFVYAYLKTSITRP